MGCCFSSKLYKSNTILEDKNDLICSINQNNYSNFISYNQNTDKKKFSIKFPNGSNYIYYCDIKKCFIKNKNINEWINNLYLDSSWNNWIVYNDETNINNYKRNHCKGILAWNNIKISWLCHSVSNFPSYFEGNKISEISYNELMYGQSFQYIEIDFTNEMIYNILNQIHIMEAHIFIEKYDNEKYKNFIFPIIKDINTIKLSDNISHVAKSPKYNFDIYGEYVVKEYNFLWNIETLIKGNLIETNCNIKDIKKLCFEDVTFNESQDHSKWGVSDKDYYCISDLNRTLSQYKKGGGIFICKDKELSKSLYLLILS